MNDSSSNAQGKGPGVYAARKSGAATVPQTTATPYKAIDLADVVSGQFDDEEAADPEHDVEMAIGSCHEGACGGDDDDGSGTRPCRRRPLEDVPHRDAANNRAAKVPRVGAL